MWHDMLAFCVYPTLATCMLYCMHSNFLPCILAFLLKCPYSALLLLFYTKLEGRKEEKQGKQDELEEWGGWNFGKEEEEGVRRTGRSRHVGTQPGGGVVVNRYACGWLSSALTTLYPCFPVAACVWPSSIPPHTTFLYWHLACVYSVGRRRRTEGPSPACRQSLSAMCRQAKS